MKRALLTFILLPAVITSYAQKIHSHNDYLKEIPLYAAYADGASCVECDMHCVDGKLLVGHDAADLDTARSFENMYLEPIVSIFRCNGGRAWLNAPERRFTLMVEIKSADPEEYARTLMRKLEPYRDVFDPDVNPDCCGILITGWKFPKDFSLYPEWFRYDFQYNGCDWQTLAPDRLEKVGSISMNFAAVSSWRGEGEINPGEKAELQKIIDFVHSKGKPVRFWGAPDCPACWDLLSSMGADWISTDRVAGCSSHLKKR